MARMMKCLSASRNFFASRRKCARGDHESPQTRPAQLSEDPSTSREVEEELNRLNDRLSKLLVTVNRDNDRLDAIVEKNCSKRAGGDHESLQASPAHIPESSSYKDNMYSPGDLTFEEEVNYLNDRLTRLLAKARRSNETLDQLIRK
mmetsp:Transcript_8462/g.18218  ORF Transcript_8462/g.18218 Transcript_8462/m.18218 type:complete len:147 (+) Transcript_8462:326-766(+)